MVSRTFLAVLWLALFAGSTSFTAAAAGDKSASWLRVSPAQVAIGKPVTITGGHLRPGQFYTLLFAVPNVSHPKASRFLGLVRADNHGALHTTAHLPLVATCGPAGVYAFLPHMELDAQATFRLTGCGASHSMVPPPPPPGSRKHKKP